MNKADYTNRIIKLTNKKNFKILDKIHKTSRFVVNEAITNNVSIIIIGYNKEWKQNSALSKKVNQNKVIPLVLVFLIMNYLLKNFIIKIVEFIEGYSRVMMEN